jgi:hypothetical protein
MKEIKEGGECEWNEVGWKRRKASGMGREWR